jgi:NADPH-dependent 2,4-dienoyl-CoA reductase/sulfur reductase-like enzyme
MLIYPTSPQSHGYQMAATRQVRQAVASGAHPVPVVGVGRIVTPAEAERHLADGDCDFVAMARALIADPEWVAKAARDEGGEIRPCVGANWCMSSIFAQAPIACIHNPAAGNERELGAGTLKRVARARKVAVVGGGPGGMRAALTAAQRGHADRVPIRQCHRRGICPGCASNACVAEPSTDLEHVLAGEGLS